MSSGEDTETLLTLISSLLHKPIYDQSILLNALVECDGDVQRAAELLNHRAPSISITTRDIPIAPTGKKRKAVGLECWLEKPSAPSTSNIAQRSKRTRSEIPTGSASTSAQSKTDPLSRSPSLKPASSGKQRKHDSDILPQISLDDSSKDATEASSKSEKSPDNKSPIKTKNVTNAEFMSILRPPNSSDNSTKPGLSKYPPLTLTTSEMIAKYVPCTMHTAILPPELACRLFYTMLDLSRNWDRNKWWLFDRLVESPHKTSFFIRRYSSPSKAESVEMDEAAQFWYNGRQTGPSPPFPDAMEEACRYVERVVNTEMHKRQRFPLEWGGESPTSRDAQSVSKLNPETPEKIIWRANVAASNCYEGTKEGVGFHSDALTYVGPYPTIASLSLGTTRTFRLREVVPTSEKDTRSARTYNIPLPHNSLTIMHASSQEMFKHAIPPQRTIDLFRPPFPPPPSLQEHMTSEPSNARINVTFRFFRPDFKPSNTPKCKCGVPCILRPDMKNRYALPAGDEPESSTKGARDGPLKRDAVAKYWWTCHAAAHNEGKGCGMWQVMDAKAEGRGPFAGEL